jgi:chromosome segregation ATPase
MTKQEDAKLDTIIRGLNGLQRNLKEFQEDVEERFRQTDEKLDEFKTEVNERFNKVDKKFDEIDKKFDEIDNRFDKVDEKLNSLKTTDDFLSGEYKRLDEDSQAEAYNRRQLSDQIEDYGDRIVKLELLAA